MPDEETHVPMTMLRSRHAQTASDVILVEQTRNGDMDAYGELWRRHAEAGTRLARSFASGHDPDDLVAESFAKILKTIKAGGGPSDAFRSYLFTTIKNTNVDWQRASRAQQLADTHDVVDERADAAFAALEHSYGLDAFATLPSHWREVLWYTEVEGISPREAAPYLGLSPNSVSALAYRAREGLRQAWIQAQINAEVEGSEHRWCLERLGAYARKGLSRRDRHLMEEHLDQCVPCSTLAGDAKQIGSRIAAVLAPLVTGLTGGGLLAWLGTPGDSARAADAAGPQKSGSSTAPARRRTVLIVAAAAVAVAAAAVSVTYLVGSAADPATGHAVAADTAAAPADPSPPSGAVVQQPTSPSPTSESPTPSTTPVPLVGTPAPSSAAPTTTSAVPPASVAPPVVSTPLSVPPTITGVDTGPTPGMLFPIVTGSAYPGAGVHITGPATDLTVVADAQGHWSTPPLTGLTAGPNRMVVTQTGQAGALSPGVTFNVQLTPPALTVTLAGVYLLTAAPNSEVQLTGGSPLQVLSVPVGATGLAAGILPWAPTPTTPTARYTLGARNGPAQ